MRNKEDLFFEDGWPEALFAWLLSGLIVVFFMAVGYVSVYFLTEVLYYVFTLSNWPGEYSEHTATLLVVWTIRFWIVVMLPAVVWYAWWERKPRRKRKEKFDYSVSVAQSDLDDLVDYAYEVSEATTRGK